MHSYGLGSSFSCAVAPRFLDRAEGLNCHLYFDKRYGGCAIESPSFAGIARAMGDASQIQGLEVRELGDLAPALQEATANQEDGITTVVEVHVTAEPTPIFRADAMVKPRRFLPKYAHLSTRGEKYVAHNHW